MRHHSKRCEYSKSKKCVCSCKGKYHGLKHTEALNYKAMGAATAEQIFVGIGAFKR